MKKKLLIVLMLFCSALLTSCSKEDIIPEEPSPSELVTDTLTDRSEAADYYCPPITSPEQIPCKINIKTGEVVYACARNNCMHNDSSCPFFNKRIRAAADTGKYMIVSISNSLGSFAGDNCYVFEYRKNELTKFSFDDKSSAIFFCDDYIYSYSISENNQYRFIRTDSVGSFREMRFVSPGKKRLCFFEEDSFIWEAEDGYYTWSFDSGEFKKIVLPDGTDDYKYRKPGFLYKTDKPGGIYILSESKFIYPDTNHSITSPVTDGLYYYYQSRSDEPCVDVIVSGSEQLTVYRYDNVIYAQDHEGRVTEYSIDSPYHFILYAAKDGCVIGKIMYKTTDSGTMLFSSEFPEDYIRIDLEANSYSVYDVIP